MHSQHGTFQPIIIRGGEDVRVQQRRHARAVVSAVLVSVILLVCIATTSHDQAAPSELEESEGGYGITVTDADIERLGLKAPSGFKVPAVHVTEEDMERYGLKPVNVSKRYVGLKVTAQDIERYGLAPSVVPSGDGEVKVTQADVDRFGLKPPAVQAAGDGEVVVTAEDVDRLGLNTPKGARGTAGSGVNVTEQDKEMYGLIMHKVEEEERKRMGLQEPLPVSDDDRKRYGMDQVKANATKISVSAEEAAALGMSGPLRVTPAEANALGLLRSAKFVTDEDVDKYGLKDPEGWKAMGAYVSKPQTAEPEPATDAE